MGWRHDANHVLFCFCSDQVKARRLAWVHSKALVPVATMLHYWVALQVASLRQWAVRRALVVKVVMETCAGSQSLVFQCMQMVAFQYGQLRKMDRDLLVVFIVVPRWLHAVWWSFGGRQSMDMALGVSRKSTVLC